MYHFLDTTWVQKTKEAPSFFNLTSSGALAWFLLFYFHLFMKLVCFYLEKGLVWMNIPRQTFPIQFLL